MRSRSILALALAVLAGLLCAGAVLASPVPPAVSPAAAPLPTVPAWLADAAAPTPSVAIGIPTPTPMILFCSPPPLDFCRQSGCKCQQPIVDCPCGGVLASCDPVAHTYTCHYCRC